MGWATPCRGCFRAFFAGRLAGADGCFPADALGGLEGVARARGSDALFLESRLLVFFAAFRVVFRALAVLAEAGVAFFLAPALGAFLAGALRVTFFVVLVARFLAGLIPSLRGLRESHPALR